MALSNFKKRVFGAALLVQLFGCASVPLTGVPWKRSSGSIKNVSLELFQGICSKESFWNLPVKVEGSIQVKVKSKPFTGQFSAQVVRQQDQLQIEIFNLFGGLERSIVLTQDSDVNGVPFKSQGLGKKKLDSADQSLPLKGIPMNWILDLFLGKIPCPKVSSQVTMNLDSKNQLILKSSELSTIETYLYRLREINFQGTLRPWPEMLHWESGGDPKSVIDFYFDQPEEKTAAPLSWEIKSKDSSLKIKWKNRKIFLKTELKGTLKS